ncbi:hypothetical protein BD777DRAFT_159609 [Yarrowia lipolytica]|nr:hypothetical protein BD777DRAFT_159609 [Yarrowia lipolytica]
MSNGERLLKSILGPAEAAIAEAAITADAAPADDDDGDEDLSDLEKDGIKNAAVGDYDDD